MTVFEAIEARKSIRAFKDQRIEKEKLLKVLEAGRQAPSAGNQQAWKFIVVQEKGLIGKLMEACNGQKFVGEAPAVLVLVANSPRQMMCGQPARTVDCSIALSFMMLLPKGNACLLTMKPDVDVNELIDSEDTPSEIKELDVSVLHQHIINQVWLGNPEIELDDQDVKYVKDAAEVLRLMKSCKYSVSFLVNPTRINQVCNIAKLGMRMPHKSTYFFPKLVTGLVMRDMNSPW
jgi:hypothetical protein